MNETLNFNYDTDEYIVESVHISERSVNDLIIRGISAACKAGKMPREF